MIKPEQQELKWYAVYTSPRSEKKVYELLKKNGFKSFLPLITTIRQWSDRKKKVQLPLIPSYVFVKTKERDLNNVLPIKGVVRILKYLGNPAVIKDYEIANLKILLGDTSNLRIINDSNLKKGDAVVVEKGVFKGLIADCIEFKGKYRVIIRIEALNNLIEINIPLNHLKKLI